MPVPSKTKIERVKFKKTVWSDIVAPDPDTLDILKKKYKFHELD